MRRRGVLHAEIMARFSEFFGPIELGDDDAATLLIFLATGASPPLLLLRRRRQ
jgi:hypothetical protein